MAVATVAATGCQVFQRAGAMRLRRNGSLASCGPAAWTAQRQNLHGTCRCPLASSLLTERERESGLARASRATCVTLGRGRWARAVAVGRPGSLPRSAVVRDPAHRRALATRHQLGGALVSASLTASAV